MRWYRFPVLLLWLAAAIGCQKSERDGASGLPKAEEWQAPAPVPSSAGSSGEGSDPHTGADMGDPHAGMDMNDPHAGMDMNDPHAGMDMNDPHAGMDMSDPHGGVDTGGDLPALPPPDPNRKVDPKMFLRGTLKAGEKTRDRVSPGSIVFLSVRPIDPLTGEVIGSPLAVDRLEVKALPLEFHLDASKAMSAGTQFKGDVILSARIDGDGDAISRQPGDLVGEVRTRIPADELALVLDTVLR